VNFCEKKWCRKAAPGSLQSEGRSSSFGAYDRLSLLLSLTIYRARVKVLTAVLFKSEVFGVLRTFRQLQSDNADNTLFRNVGDISRGVES
jgi:hypothetical protein